MTHRIFKYQADDSGVYRVPFRDARVVHVAYQPETGSDFPTIWCRVDVHRGDGETIFQCIGTGHPLEPRATLWGSAVCGPFVWHVCGSYPTVPTGDDA